MVPPGIIDPQRSVIDQGNKPKLLRIYISYRLLLSVLFLALTHFQLASDYLGISNQQLLSLTIVLYSIISVGTAVMFYRQHWKPGETVLFAMLLIETIAITSMMHTSESSDGSLGYLLMVTVAASGIFQRGILALALAAIASLILVSMALTESRIALQLQRLNDLVINRMRTGILVFDRGYRIDQLNERASMLLGQCQPSGELQRTANLPGLGFNGTSGDAALK